MAGQHSLLRDSLEENTVSESTQMAADVAQLTECLPSREEPPGENPSTAYN